MSKTEDWKLPPADFVEEDRWKAFATGLDELNMRDVMKRLNLSRPFKFGVVGGMRYIDFAECQMVALSEEECRLLFQHRANKLHDKATAVCAENDV